MPRPELTDKSFTITSDPTTVHFGDVTQDGRSPGGTWTIANTGRATAYGFIDVAIADEPILYDTAGNRASYGASGHLTLEGSADIVLRPGTSREIQRPTLANICFVTAQGETTVVDAGPYSSGPYLKRDYGDGVSNALTVSWSGGTVTTTGYDPAPVATGTAEDLTRTDPTGWICTMSEDDDPAYLHLTETSTGFQLSAYAYETAEGDFVEIGRFTQTHGGHESPVSPIGAYTIEAGIWDFAPATVTIAEA